MQSIIKKPITWICFFTGATILYFLWEWQKTIPSPLGDFIAWGVYFISFLYPILFIVVVHNWPFDKKQILTGVLTPLFIIIELMLAYYLHEAISPRGHWWAIIFYPILFASCIILFAASYYLAKKIIKGEST